MKVVITRLEGNINYYNRKLKSYFIIAKDYIPATTIRGAIEYLYLARFKRIDDTIYASSAFPIIEDRPTAPAHPFMYRIERKSNEMVEDPGAITNKAKPNPEKVKEPKPSPGSLVLEKEKKEYYYDKYTPKKKVEMHVAVSKFTGSSQKGMLYAYEYIKGVQGYWFLTGDNTELKEGDELKIGRGRTREGGKLVVEKVYGVKLEEVKGGGEVGLCLSQCTPKVLGIEALEVNEIWGYYDIYNSWFTSDGVSGTRPSFRVLGEGSVIEVKKVKEDFKTAGLNFIVSVPDLHSLLKEVKTK